MAHARVLGRLLVNDPRLPLDEPLGKLDSLTRMTLQGELLKIWQTSRFTSFLVAHDVEEALLLTQRSSSSATGRPRRPRIGRAARLSPPS